MSALTEAREALEAAREIQREAVAGESSAKGAATAIRERLAAGETKIKPADLTAADAKVEHARLVAVGAERPIDALTVAVRNAEIDALCDSIVGNLPTLGSRVRASVETLLDALEPFVAAASAYDEFIDDSTRQVSRSHHDLSSRVSLSRFSAPMIDHKPLESCRGSSQLAKATLPAFIALGGPPGYIDALRQLAAGAPNLPTV